MVLSADPTAGDFTCFEPRPGTPGNARKSATGLCQSEKSLVFSGLPWRQKCWFPAPCIVVSCHGEQARVRGCSSIRRLASTVPHGTRHTAMIALPQALHGTMGLPRMVERKGAAHISTGDPSRMPQPPSRSVPAICWLGRRWCKMGGPAVFGRPSGYRGGLLKPSRSPSQNGGNRDSAEAQLARAARRRGRRGGTAGALPIPAHRALPRRVGFPRRCQCRLDTPQTWRLKNPGCGTKPRRRPPAFQLAKGKLQEFPWSWGERKKRGSTAPRNIREECLRELRQAWRSVSLRISDRRPRPRPAPS